MATTTPNFGWTVPTSSDLVKNGAVAIETLGDAIDASLVDLKGGTTGQVLTKASGTDMDFSWAAASSGSSNVAGKNAALNSNFSVWQRGTSVATSTSSVKNYTADQWNLFRGGLASGATMSRQVTGDTTNLPFIQYCARVQRDSGNTSTSIINLYQSLETINSIQFAGKTVTISFYARAGANYSNASSNLSYFVNTGTGTDQNGANNGFTGLASPINPTATLTTTWQRFSASGTISASATQVGFGFTFTPVGTAGANDYFEITGVQLEIGSSASAYSPNAATIQGERAACERYYQRWDLANFTKIGSGVFFSSTAVFGCFIPPKVTFRATPTLATAGLVAFDGANSYAATISSNLSLATNIGFDLTVTGATALRVAMIGGNNTSNAYFEASAEL